MLIGDSREYDVDIYQEVVKEYPNQILKDTCIVNLDNKINRHLNL